MKISPTIWRRGQGEGSVYQRKDGRYVGSFRLENGKRKYVYGESRMEVREKLRVAIHEYKQGTLVAGSNQTLKQFLEQWFQAKRMELKDGTYRYYKGYVETHIVPVLGHLKLQKVNDAHLQSFYAALLEKKTHRDANLSPNTVRLIHSILHEAFDAAVHAKKVVANPCSLVTPPRSTKKELRYLTAEQALHLLEVAGTRQHRLEYLLILALTTGMRQGELLALHWSDIDFARGTVHVARSLAYHHSSQGTGKQNRKQPIPEERSLCQMSPFGLCKRIVSSRWRNDCTPLPGRSTTWSSPTSMGDISTNPS